MGDAGLVYDSQGLLIWDGVKEYSKNSDDTNKENRT